ncbi:MAG: acetyltransferase [Candidatus Omnitrophica bacterium]|nr:acetyltransferase [Candidatus Omnitrophota bacterium]MCM8790634.1 acetyltransferase [Candidatus Omnitrophota bacterium]
MPDKLIIFPFGGNAREAASCVMAINETGRKWDLIGFIDDDRSLIGKESCGVRVLGGIEILKRYPEARVLAVPGNPNTYLARKKIIDDLKIEERRFATILHPSVSLAPDAKIGYNTIVMQNVVVSCGAQVGNHCVILPNSVISHDSVIGDYCCLGSNVSVSGRVVIEPVAYIGSGVKIRDGIRIGKKALIGIGSVVIKDVGSKMIVAGNPTRIIREVSE